MKNKSIANFVIETLMFICIVTIAGLGFLMKYILIPGEERWAVYGRNVDLSFLGMDRHEWGIIHLTIGFVLLGLLILHIVFHWKVILSMYRGLVSCQKTRKMIAKVFIIISAALILFPFVINIKIQELERGEGRRAIEHGEEIIEPPKENLQDSQELFHIERSIEIRGYMTFSYIAREYDIPIEYLKKQLGIPESVSNIERLSWLRRDYDFKMSDVERVIIKYYQSR